MNQIAPGLYQGALYDAVQLGMPKDVDTILLLTSESDSVKLPHGQTTPLPEVIRFPIQDVQAGLDQWTFRKLSEICERIASKKVCTLCFKGENRAGLASALILIHRGYSPEEAIKTVQSNGPSKTAGKTSLWNMGFQRQLRGMAA